MSYTLEKLPKESIIVFRAAANYDVISEINSVLRDAMVLLNAVTEPVFQIIDFTAMPGIDMDSLMVGTSAATRGSSAPFQHPMVRQTVFVSRNPAFKMAADGMSDDVFGNLYVPVYENFEDALAYVRSQLK